MRPPNGNEYTLRMAEDGIWRGIFVERTVALALGNSGSGVSLHEAEDGGRWIGNFQFMSGDIRVALNGERYRPTLMGGQSTAALLTDWTRRTHIPPNALPRPQPAFLHVAPFASNGAISRAWRRPTVP